MQMIVEQADGHLLQCPGRRTHLRDHIGAPAVVLDHLLQPADLTLDLAEPGQVVGLAGGVPAGSPPHRSGANGGCALARGRNAGNASRGHDAFPELTGLSDPCEPIMSRSRRYSAASISPRARRSSRMRRAPPPWFILLRVVPRIRA